MSPSLSYLKGGSQVEEFASQSVLRSSLRSGSVVVPKDVRETQSLNEVWLKVQRRFIQDHKDLSSVVKQILIVHFVSLFISVIYNYVHYYVN